MTTTKTKQCQLRGKGCQGEFELNSGQGGSNRKYCDNCQKLMAKKRRIAYEKREREKRAKLPEESKGFKKKLCKGWQFGLEERFPTEMAIRKVGGKTLPPLPCLGWFKPTCGAQLFCSNCKVTRLRARQGAEATAAYRAEKEQFDATGDCPQFEKRLQRGRKSANAHNKRQRKRLAKAEQLVLDLYAEVDAAKQAVAEKEAKLATAEKKLRRAKAPEETSAGKICRAINAELPAFERFFATPENVEALRQGARSIDGLSKSQTAAAGHAIKSKDSTRWPVIAVRYFVSDATGVSYDVVARYHQSSSRAFSS
jgi:hypothetical protein